MAAFITSNLASVLKQLNAFKARLPYTAHTAMAHTIWLPSLREVARTTLTGLAAGNEALTPLVPQFLAGISGRTWKTQLRVRFSMVPPETYRGSAVSFMIGAPAKTRRGAQDDEQMQEILKQFDEGVLDWVEAGAAGDPDGKRIKAAEGERDFGQTPREIATRILIFFDRRKPTYGDRDSPSAREEAKQNLSPAIYKFLAKPGRGGKADQDVAEKWLRAVGLAWFEYMQTYLGPAMKRKVVTDWNKTPKK